MFQNRSIKWFSDSESCVRIVSAGSTKTTYKSKHIYQLCLKWNINLGIQWIPGNFNFFADSISKVNCTDNWGVSDDFFQLLNSLWGPFDIDRFANLDNMKLFRYNARFFDYQLVDAFTQNLRNANNMAGSHYIYS